jgi:hypothetical protein
MKHDKTCHDLPHMLFGPCKSRLSENGKASLQHTKCPLHIFSGSLLHLSKPSFLLSRYMVQDCLHKCPPFWIETICKIVTVVILVAIDLKLHRRGIASDKILKHIGALQHIDINVILPCQRTHEKSTGPGQPLPQPPHYMHPCAPYTCHGVQIDSSSMFSAYSRCCQAS